MVNIFLGDIVFIVGGEISVKCLRNRKNVVCDNG